MEKVTLGSTETVKTTSGAPGTSLNTTVVQKITRECLHIDGAVLIAEYIVQEIKTNVKSDTANTIRYKPAPEELENMRQVWKKLSPQVRNNSIPPGFNMGIDKLKWGLAVRPDIPIIGPGKWNHKPKIRELFRKYAVHRPLRADDPKDKWVPSESHFHKYKGYDYFLDVWSNIHYAYVGLSIGFDEATLIDGSDSAQKATPGTKGGDTKDDKTSINIGFALYKKFGKYAERLTAQDILDALEQVNAKNEMPYSKQVHWCWNEANKSETAKAKD